MVLQILDSDLGNIDSVPTRLNDFLQKYIRSSGSEEFLAKETKSFSTQDGKFSKVESSKKLPIFIFPILK